MPGVIRASIESIIIIGHELSINNFPATILKVSFQLFLHPILF